MRFWIVIALILVLSAVGLTYEIAAGRVLAPFFGTSLLTWTAVIATVLAGFSVGSAWGGLVAERPRPQAVRVARLALVATGVLMALSPTVLGLAHASGARGTFGMFVTVVLTFFPASVAVTLPSPLLAKIAVEARPGREGSSLGLVLSAGSLGAILGAVLAGFVALPLVGSVATFAGCGAVALICIPFLRGADDPHTTIALGAGSVVLFAGLAGGAVCQYESGLSCLSVSEERGEVRLYADRTLQAAEPIDGGADGPLALSYTQWIWDRMDRDLGPDANVLFIGGGGYTLPTRLLSTRANATAVAVEIDPLVTQVVQAHLPQASQTIAATGHDPDETLSGGRLGIVHADGRVYLNETERRFDAAVLDAFSSGAVPAHLVTRESFARLRDIVSGPIYVNLIDRPDGPLAQGVHAILTELYPQVRVLQSAVAPSGRANIVIAAGPAAFDPLDALPDGYAPVTITAARAFTDDRGWVGHR